MSNGRRDEWINDAEASYFGWHRSTGQQPPLSAEDIRAGLEQAAPGDVPDESLDKIPPNFATWARIDWRYPRIEAADAVVFALDGENRLCVATVQRGSGGHELALPGGVVEPIFVEEDATPEATARRELREETGLELPTGESGSANLGQLYPIGWFDAKDPRGPIFTHASGALVVPDERSVLPPVVAGDDALPGSGRWTPIDEFLESSLAQPKGTWAAHGTIVAGATRWLGSFVNLVQRQEPNPQLDRIGEAIAELQPMMGQFSATTPSTSLTDAG